MKAIKTIKPKQIEVTVVTLELDQDDVAKFRDLLDTVSSMASFKEQREFVESLKAGLDNPELRKEAPIVPPTSSKKSKSLGEGLDPNDALFKSAVVRRFIQTYPLDNVPSKETERYKKEAVKVARSGRKIAATPKSNSDEDFFDWLVEAGFIDNVGNITLGK